MENVYIAYLLSSGNIGVIHESFECAALERRGVKKMADSDVSVSVKLAGKLRRLAAIDRRQIAESVVNLVSRRKRVIRSGALNLDIRQNNERFRKVPLFSCRARFWNRGRNIAATGEEYGIWQTVDNALDKIEHKMIQSKERGLRFG